MTSKSLRPSSLWNDLNFLSILNNSEGALPDDADINYSIASSNTSSQNKLIRKKNLPRIPLTKIRKMIKDNSLNDQPTNEALFVLAKAVEIFVESLVAESYENVQSSKKRILTRRDIDVTIENIDSLGFLIGLLD